MGIPLLAWPTQGVKEEELQDLSAAIAAARERYGIQGIVTGAIESVYQAARVQRICRDLDLWCYNPLWQTNQIDYLRRLLKEGFSIIISGVYAYPFDASWLGAQLTEERIQSLVHLQQKYKINPSGEGGELETFVLDGPFFQKRIEIMKASQSYANYRGQFVIEEMRLVEKQVREMSPEMEGEIPDKEEQIPEEMRCIGEGASSWLTCASKKTPYPSTNLSTPLEIRCKNRAFSAIFCIIPKSSRRLLPTTIKLSSAERP